MKGNNNVSIRLDLDNEATVSFQSGGARNGNSPPLYVDVLELGAVSHRLNRQQTICLLHEMIAALPYDAEEAVIDAGITREYLRERMEKGVL